MNSEHRVQVHMIVWLAKQACTLIPLFPLPIGFVLPTIGFFSQPADTILKQRCTYIARKEIIRGKAQNMHVLTIHTKFNRWQKGH